MQGINKFLNLVIVLGCVVIGYIFFQAKTENDKSNRAQQQAVEQSSVRPAMDPQDLANKYLQQAQQNLVTDKLKAEINIKKAILESQQVQNPNRIVETDPSKIPIEQQIWKDPTEQMRAEKPLDQRFSEQLAPKNGELDKQEYIRQFKENARKNGYEITVNDELEVTSITPIRKPQNSKNDYDSNQNSESEY
ncbi:MAG: hypothetical protein V4654_08930 [Bdellovibrionota bacterium]